MTINGLSGNRYLSNNPIWVEITGAGSKVLLTFNTVSETSEIYTFTFYTFNGRAVFDLSEIVKTFLPEPNHPTAPIAGQVISTNSVSLGMTFQSGAESQTINKTFFRGGEDSMRTNISLPSLSVLKESDKIPVWQGYPSAKYTLNANNQVVFNNLLANDEIERRKVVVCTPVFLRFLNTRGGYSFWMFEEWRVSKKAKSTTRIERQGNPLDLGLNTTHELEATSRVEERYTATLTALLQSPEVWCYNMNTIMNRGEASLVPTVSWTRIYNNGGTVRWNAFEQMNEYSVSFDLLFKQNPTLIW